MKKRLFKSLLVSVICLLIISGLTPIHSSAATRSTNLVEATKSIDLSKLSSDDEAEVTLNIKGTPQQTTNIRPNDIILIIDKSGSMSSDNRLEAAKTAAQSFIDIIDLNVHRVGIVDFSDTAQSMPLSTDASSLKSYIGNIKLAGSTNTSGAVNLATSLLANHRPDVQPTIIILTDGAANDYNAAKQSATAAKNAGINFYSIAVLDKNEDPDKSAPNALLKEMATSAAHHHFVLGSVGIPEIYKKIAEEIGVASAYDVKITDTLAPEFEFVGQSYNENIPQPTVNGNTLTWNIKELKSDALTLKYKVRVKKSTALGKYSIGNTAIEYSDFDKNHYNNIVTNPTVTVNYPKPVITSVEPNKGLTAGGEEVTIHGDKFRQDSKVFFGNTEATVQSITDKEIKVVTPPGAQGTTQIKVQNPDGQFATNDFLYYAYPTITQITPNNGPIEGGNKATVIGTNFLPGSKVYINDQLAATTYSTVSKLYVVIPSSTTFGKVNVKVENPDGTSAQLVESYEYLEPPTPPAVKLTSLSDSSDLLKGGKQVYLLGENFNRAVKVYFGDKEATVNYFANSSKIRVIVPEGDTAGFVTIKVENPDGTTSELNNIFEYKAPPPAPAPEITSLSLNEILINEEKTIYIFGNNIAPSAKVSFGNIEVPIDFVTTSKIRVKVPKSAVAGTVDVTLTNPDNQSSTLANGFTYTEPIPDPAPVITEISASTGSVNGKELVTIKGQNFTQYTKVYFGDRLGIVKKFVSSSEIIVETPSNSIGIVNVKVMNADGQEFTLNNGYTYEGLVATITSLSANSGPLKGGNLVTVYGTNFNPSMKVSVDGIDVPVTYLAPTRIRIKMPSINTAKTVDIIAELNGGTSSIQYTYY
ncbi:IPT/TIG domain-containing protein [Heyndrickxia sp. FSL K6-6286]|uniref:IPT/TIG domain-containing protein n=1 Tax=Heyndrickxia sp. FSL K6-6286 TaxID=2921510 RepID=UPI00217CD790|nr:IPT/TIG domain-containing protein [Heyndrickxia oleronia]